MDNQKLGYWSIATQKHLKKFQPDSTNLDELDSINITGKTGRFIGLLRGNSYIDNLRKIEKMAGTIGIHRAELHSIILPKLEKASDKKIVLKKNTLNEVIGIEEYLFKNKDVFSITSDFFEFLNPSNIERIAIESLDETKRIPLLENELFTHLEKQGFSEEDISISCLIQEQFRLVQKLSNGGEAIFSNEYVWGQNHDKIAYTISKLNMADKDEIKKLISLIQNKQGLPAEYLQIPNSDLIQIAKNVGMLNPTTISTKRGVQKEFIFSSDLDTTNFYDNDVLDDIKLLLAAIRFGQNYTEYSRIQDPIEFLDALIDRERVGPHSANATDYILLERRGIVKVEPSTLYKDRYFLRLLKKDVGRAAKALITDKDYGLIQQSSNIDINSIMDGQDFLSPEELRISFGEKPQLIMEAEDYIARVLRDEIL
ncbi:hypothetical protein NRS6120_14565 [Bacillus subtilis]|nr:hypothetical protein [Bacillus subtilis]CAF1770275.1 hypothetical protein NRS6120_02075 [Bacillus subtilis]CAI6292252.1 hypothetical protein NRS6120_14565 [Bacillus subtilis]